MTGWGFTPEELSRLSGREAARGKAMGTARIKSKKFHCQECGQLVESTEYHPLETCLEWKRRHGGYFEDDPTEEKKP